MKLSKKILSLLLAASLVLSSGMVLAAANGQNPSTSTTGPANPDPDDTELNCPESENGYHVGTPKTVSKEATCSDFGIVTLDECEACHKKLVPVIVKKDKDKHTAEMQELQYVDSTCTNTGNYETFHCDDCGEYYTKDKDGNPQYVEVEDPQDLANTEGVVIAMKAHDYDTEHPTDMKRTFVCAFEVTYKCKNCTSTKVVRIAEDPDDVLDPHTPVTDAAVEPTCTEPGLTEGSHCSVCGITIVAQKTLPATDHKFGEWEMLDVTEEGLLQHKGICQNESRKQLCRETLTEDCYDAEPVYTAATCTEDAYWTNTCDKCGRKWETTDEENPATGHTWVEREELKILPTCTEQGQNIYRCAVCDEEYTEYTHDTHHYNSEPTDKEKEPTCTEVGYDEVYVCTVCGEPKYKGMKDMVPHTPAEAVKENEVDATCTEQGSYDSVIYCSVCEEELSRETVTTELIAHTLAAAVKENETAATVKAEGSYDSVVYCSVCKTELSREKVTVDKLPETKIEVAENDHMKFLADKGILIIDGSVTKEILMKNCNATSIADAEGKAPEDDTLKTGMQLLMFVGDERTDAVTLALLGDVDCNGTVSVADARLALRKAVGLEDNLSVCSLFAADVDFTGDVTVSDARVILRIAVSLEDGKDLIAKSKTAK